MDEFIEETKQKLESVMQRLGWDLETMKKQRSTSVCQYDDKHSVPSQGLVKHELLCNLWKQGLSKKEAASVHDTGFCYAESPQVTSFSLTDQEKKNVLMSRCINDRYEIGGMDMHRLLTPPERLALYEYMIEKVRFENKLHKIPDEQLLFLDDNSGQGADGKQGFSIAEVRDLKRRRQTYRAKNVHVTKKSYTMVMRDVLENQFKILEHRLKADAELEEELRKNPPKRDAREGSVRSHGESSVGQRQSCVRDERSASVRSLGEGSSRQGMEGGSRTDASQAGEAIQVSREPSRARGDRWRHDKFDEGQPPPRVDSRVERSMSKSHDRRESRDQIPPRGIRAERAQSRDHAERSRDHTEGLRDHTERSRDHTERSRDHTEGSRDYTERSRDHTEGSRDYTERSREYGDIRDRLGYPSRDQREYSRDRDRTRDHDKTRDHDRTRDHERTRDSSRTPSGKYRDHHDKQKRSRDDKTGHGHRSRDRTRDTPPRASVSSQVELHYDNEIEESSSRSKHRSRSKRRSRSRHRSRSSSKKSKSGDRRKSRDSRKSREGSSKRKKSTKKKSRKRKRSTTEEESTERKAKRRKHKQKKKKKKRTKESLSGVDQSIDSDENSDVDSEVVSDDDIFGSDVAESDVHGSGESSVDDEENSSVDEEAENVSVDEEAENVSAQEEEEEIVSVDEDELSEPSLSPSD